MVALDSAVILNPRVWEASGPRRRLHRPADRLPYLQAPLPRRPARGRALRPEAVEASGRDAGLRPHGGAPVQPHVPDAGRRDGGRLVDRVPPAGDRAGHLHQLQERRCSSRAASRRSGSRRSASRSATRSRRATSSSACASSSRWRWSTSCRPTRRERWYAYWIEQRLQWYLDLGLRRSQLRVREHSAGGAVALLERDERHRVPLPDRLAGARGRREPRRLRPHAAHAALRHEARVGRAGGRALHAARDRARRVDRTYLCRHARATRTTRRSSANATAPCCACIRAIAPVKAADPAADPAQRGDGRRARGRCSRSCAVAGSSSTTTAARSAAATAGRTRSARRGRSRSTSRRSRTRRSPCATATRSRRSACRCRASRRGSTTRCSGRGSPRSNEGLAAACLGRRSPSPAAAARRP